MVPKPLLLPYQKPLISPYQNPPFTMLSVVPICKCYSGGQEMETVYFALFNILRCLYTVKDYLSGIENVILNLDNNTEEQLVH